MSEQQQPELPAGAIPTEIDAVPQADEVGIDVTEISATADALIAEGEFGTEEPLPVGANDPEVVADQPVEPPGMPHQPDDLDREMAAKAQDYHDHWFGAVARQPERGEVRPDIANVHDARNECILPLRARNVREALLVHAQEEAKIAREAVQAYARALVEVYEARETYVAAMAAAGGAEEALFVMGLDTEEDADVVEPTEAEAPAPVPDSAIV